LTEIDGTARWIFFAHGLKSGQMPLFCESMTENCQFFRTLVLGGRKMSLTSYEPWLGARQLQDEINRLFSGVSTNDTSGVTADWVPNVDINEFEEQFQLFVDIPGVDPRHVEITLENAVLTISGERFAQAPKDDQKVVHRRSERATGRFYRRFILPDSVDIEKVRATDRHGVLEIEIPKQAKALPKRIKVAAAA
jgi:HSP20 family protein